MMLDFPPEKSVSIFISGFVGDVVAVESFLSDYIRKNVETIYYSTDYWKHQTIKFLFNSLPNYPNLKNHIFIDNKSLFKEPCLELGENYANSMNYACPHVFDMVSSKKLKFNGSSFVKYQLCDISKFNLNYPYIAINPYSTDKYRRRDFNNGDWDVVINYLYKNKIKGVVLNIGDDYIPSNEMLVNLSNKTNILESIEIVKESVSFIGVDSCLTIIATKCFQSNNIGIKVNKSYGFYTYRECYCAPLTDYCFIEKLLPNFLIHYLL